MRATGAIVPERQRCTCPDGLCLDHCRACNHSGRDLEETCIADPDWEPDDEYLAIRERRAEGETNRAQTGLPADGSCRRCGLSARAAIAGVLCDPPHGSTHDFPNPEGIC